MMHKNIGKRVMALLLSLCMIAGMVDWTGLTVRAADKEYISITAEWASGSPSFPYTGSAIEVQKDQISVSAGYLNDSGDVVEEQVTDFNLEYENHTNQGQATVIVSVEGCSSTARLYFTITPLDLSSATFEPSVLEPEYAIRNGRYTPKSLPKLKVGAVEVPADQYTWDYSGNDLTDGQDEITATATATAKENGNFTGSASISYKIHRMKEENLTITLKADGKILVEESGHFRVNYNQIKGEKFELTSDLVEVKYTDNGKEEILKANQYKLVYDGNQKSVGEETVYAVGTSGKYLNLRSARGAKFWIRKFLSGSGGGVTAQSDVTFSIEEQEYPKGSDTLAILKGPDDGDKNINTELTINDPDVRREFAEIPNSDKVKVTLENSNWKSLPVQDGLIHTTVRISALNTQYGYNGYRSAVPITIRVNKLTDDMVEVDGYDKETTGTYRGMYKTDYDGITNWLDIIESKISVPGYTKGTDYKVTRETKYNGQGINVGTYTNAFRVESLSNGALIGGPVYISVRVDQRDINKISVILNQTYTYNGLQQTPKLNELTITDDGGKLSENDYSIGYGKNVNAYETATIIITGKNNYKNTKTVEFTIQPLELVESTTGHGNVEVVSPNETSYVYKGGPQTPKVEIYVNRQPSTQDSYLLGSNGAKDYTVKYTANNTENETGFSDVSDGKITMTISGFGNFSGEITREFEITPLELNVDTVQFPVIPDQPYTGSRITPNVDSVYQTTLKKTLTNEKDYDLDYGVNINVGDDTNNYVVIKGRGNYTGEVRHRFNIVKCDLSNSNMELIVTAQGLDAADVYTFTHNDPSQITPEENRIYPYKGEEETELENIIVRHGQRTMTFVSKDGDPASGDYTVTYEANTNIGTAQLVITGVGTNYKGIRKLPFRIKGNLTPLNSDGRARASVTKNQIYNAGIIVPPEEDLLVTFQLANGMNTLKLGEDFTIENPDKVGPTQVGTGTGKLKITGIGNYYGGGDINFNVDPLDLTFEDLEEKYGYKIDGINEDPYPYSDIPTMPEPTITHNGKEVTFNNDYTLKYYKGKDELNSNSKFNVGSDYSVEITGAGDNYIKSTKKGYKIRQYDLSKDGVANGKIRLDGIADEVVLDDIKYGQSVSPDNAQRTLDSSKAEMGNEGNEENHEHNASAPHSRDEVVWKNLQVFYTPVGIDGREGKERPLVYGEEYTVTYENNKEPGTAKYTIQGIGNFDGKIEKEFKILVNLGSERIKIEAEDCYYSPENPVGTATNRPDVTVSYNLEMFDEPNKVVNLTKDTDYLVDYRDNKYATHPNPENSEGSALEPKEGDGGKIIITGNVAGDKHVGLGSGNNESNPKTFAIYQRDISKYGEGTDLEFSGLLEEGYEYNEDEIIPNLKLTCKSVSLIGVMLKKEEVPPSTPYDYTVRAENNINVWTETEVDGVITRVFPKYTVSAKTNEDGKYDGNYCGEITGEFTINPRKINEETVDTRVPIVNLRKDNLTDTEKLDEDGWRWAYSRKPINFPKTGSMTNEDPVENGLQITWSNGTDVKELIEGTDYTIQYENNVGIGEATILVNTPEKSNYIGPYEKHFSIVASITEVDRELDPGNPNDERYMELPWGNPETVPYGIVETYPDLRFEDYSRVLAHESDEPYILQLGKDFEIVTQSNPDPDKGYSQNNKNVTKEGENATVVVRGIGNYEGAVSRTYKIVPKDLSDKGIVVQFSNCEDYSEILNPYIFNGNAQEPKFEVYNNNAKDIESMEEPEEPDESEGTEGPSKPPYNPYQDKLKMKLGTDYVIDKWENNVGPMETKGHSYLHLKAKEGSNYTGTLKVEFNIVLRQMSGLTYEIENVTYNGSPLEPAVKVSYKDEQNKTVVLDPEKDYDILEYKNNVDVPLADAEEADRPSILLKGKGGYGGEKKIYFNIAPRDINSKEITATGAALYNKGEAVKPEITVKDAGVLLGKTLVEGTDYVIKEGSQSNEVEIGATGTVTIEGQGNYTGTRQRVEFRIIPPNGVLKIDQIPDQNFNNQPIRPEITVSLLAEGIDTAVPLTENDYDVTYTNHQNAGTATVTVTGKAPFTGTATATFVIHPKKISNEDGTIASGMSLGNIGVQQYTGSPLTPKASLTFNPSAQPEVKDEEDPSKPVELIAGRDYILSYDKNVMPGKAKAIVKGINNYAGSLETEFEIHADMSKVTIAPIPVQDYTGSAVTPLPVVSLGGQRLTLDTDYRVTYSNNVDRGTATITIQGIEPWFVGKRTVNFDIARELSEGTVIRGVAASYTYTGAAIAPPVRVEDDGNLLKSGVDYEISYSQNIDAGTATIVIKGIGKYTGSTSTTFKITPQQLGRAKISPISDRVYNGKEQKPPVTITSGSKTLENGKDYTLVYVNSTTPGMASVIVKGEGNFTGTQTLNYKITVPALSGVKFSKYTNKTVTISWKKNSVVTGYEIYNSKNRRALRIKSASTTSGTVKKLKAGTAATFRVRAYVNKDGQYYYGPFKSIKTATAPNSTKITSLTSKKAKQAVIKWKKVSGATQYEVYRSTSKKGKYKKIATTKKTSYTDKKATGGKKYYYKIRVCKKISKKNYYSSYSGVKSVKAKK